MFNKICEFATIDVFNLAAASAVKNKWSNKDSGVGKLPGPRLLYSSQEVASLREAMEAVREEVWIEALHGQMSTLLNDTWLEKVTKLPDCKFIFNASQLRAKLFAKANVEVRHGISI